MALPRDPQAPILRRFLAYRLDFSKAPWLKSKNPCAGIPITPRGPEAYDDPTSALYWRAAAKKSVKAYNEVLADAFNAYLLDIMQALQDGNITLKMTNTKLPFLDFTGAIKIVRSYGNSLAEFSNTLSLDVFLTGNAAWDAPSLISDYSPGSLPPSSPLVENDLIQVKVSFDGGATYQDEFVGLVTQVGGHLEEGGIPSAPLEIYGLSKNLVLSSVVKQSSTSGQEFQPGVQIDQAQSPSPFQSIFEPLNVKGIFTKILNDTMSLQPSAVFRTFQTLAIANPTLALNNGPTAFNGFQYNLLSLLTLALANEFIIDTTKFPPQDPPLDALFPNRTQGGSVFDAPYQAVIEHGEHQAFNLMTATAYSNFFATMDHPASILGEVRKQSMYEIFESLDGVLVCRPPRYNRIEISNSEIDRYFLNPNVVGPGSILILDPDSGRWEFNPHADYAIPANEWKTIDQQRQDDTLQSMAVSQFMLQSVGAQDFLSGTFTDPGILAKYGLRIGDALQNPNVINPAMAQSYPPIALGVANASATSASVSVFDRPFRVGKLYILKGGPGQALAGYLISQSISHQEGTVGLRNLNLTLLREVVWRPIKEMLALGNEYELLNFALMYLPDPIPPAVKPDSRGLSASQPVTEFLINEARVCLTAMSAKSSKGIQSVPMFRYVPTILDLVVQLDDNPNQRQPTQKPGDPGQQQRETARRALSTSSAPEITGLFTAMGTDKSVEYLDDVQKIIQTWSGESIDSEKALGARYPIPSGVLRYGNPAPSTIQTLEKTSFSLMNPNNAVTAGFFTRTGQVQQEGSSFLPLDAAGDSSSAIPMVRDLINSLVTVDIVMKFDGDSPNGPNPNGFPQLYGMVADSNGQPCYRLFGSLRDPSNYIKTTRENSYDFDFTALKDYPNLLKYDSDRGFFQSTAFRIPIANGFFNLPDGHLAWLVNDQWSFALIRAGRYKISAQQNVTGGYGIRAIPSSGAFVLEESQATTDEANFPAPPLNGYTPLYPKPFNYEQGGPKGTGDFIEIAAPNGFYFLSPWSDMTMERMADAAVVAGGNFPVLLGYRTSAEEQTLIDPAKDLAAQSGNDLHLKGQAYDFIPDLLTAASQSDMRPLQAAYDLLASFATKNGFNNSNPQSFGNFLNGGDLTYTYPDGTPAKTSVGQWFHFGITDAKVASFLHTYIPIPGVSSVGEGQPANPGPGGTVTSS